MCQGCVDKGYLSQTTYNALEAFMEAWPHSEFGPAHIVLSDANVDDGSIRWCLNLIRAIQTGDATAEHAIIGRVGGYAGHEADELAATAVFLKQLLLVPEVDR